MVGTHLAVEHPPAAEGAGHDAGDRTPECAAPVAFGRHALERLGGFFAFAVNALHGFPGRGHEIFFDRNLLFEPFHLEDFDRSLAGQRSGGGLNDHVLFGVYGDGEQGFGDAALAVRHRGRDDALAEPRKGDVRELFVDDDADPNGGPLFGLFRGVDGQGRGQRAAADGQNETSGEQGDPAVTEYHGILHWRERR